MTTRTALRIGEVATRTGVSVRSLRYYEEQQLITADRTPSGQRVYAENVVERVDLIQLLYRAGLTSRHVLELLPCLATGTTTPTMLDRLLSERERIHRQVVDLTATRARLDGVIVEASARLGVAI